MRVCALTARSVQREGLPQMFSSNELLQPLADMLRVVGMTRTAKNTSEEMTVWLQSSLDVSAAAAACWRLVL